MRKENWVSLTRRTDDPKLAYIERRLDEIGIPHRRNGSSWHAPILEVLVRDFGVGWEVMGAVIARTDPGGNPITLDDLDDNDPIFTD